MNLRGRRTRRVGGAAGEVDGEDAGSVAREREKAERKRRSRRSTKLIFRKKEKIPTKYVCKDCKKLKDLQNFINSQDQT